MQRVQGAQALGAVRSEHNEIMGSATSGLVALFGVDPVFGHPPQKKKGGAPLERWRIETQAHAVEQLFGESEEGRPQHPKVNQKKYWPEPTLVDKLSPSKGVRELSRNPESRQNGDVVQLCFPPGMLILFSNQRAVPKGVV